MFSLVYFDPQCFLMFACLKIFQRFKIGRQTKTVFCPRGYRRKIRVPKFWVWSKWNLSDDRGERVSSNFAENPGISCQICRICQMFTLCFYGCLYQPKMFKLLFFVSSENLLHLVKQTNGLDKKFKMIVFPLFLHSQQSFYSQEVSSAPRYENSDQECLR